MDDGDSWFARDKIYHVIFCFIISLTVSTLSSLTPYPFLRRRSIWIGSLASLSAGAAKEAADELGFFHSAGASSKDAVADLLGVLFAFVFLSLCNKSRDRPPHLPEVSMIKLRLGDSLAFVSYIYVIYRIITQTNSGDGCWEFFRLDDILERVKLFVCKGFSYVCFQGRIN
ncbi:hypothetical protein RJ641_020233 [Dillenia turbinata]|uniref:Uncharacterized protein n=1 Tax=Dillenia turbinata TaxID=194707 RepID=A0AAN8UPN1_9MAGN